MTYGITKLCNIYPTLVKLMFWMSFQIISRENGFILNREAFILLGARETVYKISSKVTAQSFMILSLQINIRLFSIATTTKNPPKCQLTVNTHKLIPTTAI